jgi:sulfate transport system permease protein
MLIAVALLFLAIFLVMPLIVVFYEGLRSGIAVYFAAITDQNAQAAIKLTLLVALIAVPINAVFGIAAAWLIARFRFRGQGFLVTLMDLPFSVSPVVAGLIFVLLFGAQGLLGPWLNDNNLRVIFALPGIVLATLFVTFPFVARELIAFMQTQGSEEEEAALMLGASGLQMFWRVTMPNIKWSLLYGIILCNARAMGEFGAVSVVSGGFAGKTNTVPLHIEMLYGGFDFAASFAVASLLALLGLVTLIIKTIAERRVEMQMAAGQTVDEVPVETVAPPALQPKNA